MARKGKTSGILGGAMSVILLSSLLLALVVLFPLKSEEVAQATKPVQTIGFIGDSITAASDSDTRSAVSREMYYLGDGYKAVNNAVNGATTADWLPGDDYFTTALTDFQAQDVTIVSIMLGTNDAQTALRVSDVEYRLHLKTIVDALLETGTIKKVILNYPPYLEYPRTAIWNEKSLASLRSYMKQIDSLVNGTTILQGDTLSYSYFKDHPDELLDGVHPNDKGRGTLGALWATSYLRLLAETHSADSEQESQVAAPALKGY